MAIKWKFVTLFNWVHAMLYSTKFYSSLQSGLLVEATSTAMLLKIIPSRPIEIWGKGKRSILASVQKFGEICITTYQDNSRWAKLSNQGVPCIWVGFTEGHPVGTYCVYNLKTQKNFNQGHGFPTEVIQRSELEWKTCFDSYALWRVGWWWGTWNSSNKSK